MADQGMAIPKRGVRMGARGASKVRTGCLVCKIRRKKCDEAKPSCTQCISTHRLCEYASSPTHPHPPSQRRIVPRLIHFSPQNFTLPEDEVPHLEFFTTAGVQEFITFFGNEIWERIALQAIFNEPCIRSAALALAAVTRVRVYGGDWGGAVRYAMGRYGRAIGELNRRLEGGRGWEVALLAALFFVRFEMVVGEWERLDVHMRCAQGIVARFMGGMSSSGIPGTGFTDGGEVGEVVGGLFRVKLLVG
ncbi:Zn2/Cys6 DNA-binding protein [Glarea lozoyensis ATCC 20868]|uniref:Zn2/Cys6 DNA-binding protein n=1 Tax=Glarea lozoyensis (strain ATCC 20868 / MF5171) TaxID=1116229 RepID=S3CLJ6_GLAL2|nr:Zn2/Cys6 DNA-binding protein [Glarea lozoyensis ATCC 20868]EPE26615.1 Zn2/Cys6 DNA-binding protein [Glarea lozoyensis ATCC 20868]